jgi:serine phosphatase RsbU (regulator of sigma subunit)
MPYAPLPTAITMNYFDRNPNIFRLIFFLLISYAVGISAITIVHFGTSPTDENLFTNPVSNLYLLAPIPVLQGYPDESTFLIGGSIPAHNLLVSINGTKVRTLQELHDVQSSLALAPPFEVTVHHLREEESRTYRIDGPSVKNIHCRELTPTAYVIDIATDGASDRAGMRIGDLIQRINGQSFANVFVADSILRTGQTGKELAYDILRDNKELRLHVTLASFGFPFPMLVAVISGLVFLSVGFFLGLKRPRIKAARILGLLFVAQGFFLTNMFIRRDLGLGGFALYINLTLLISLAITFPLYAHSLWYFPREVTERIRHRWLLLLGYGLAVLQVVMTIIFDNTGFFIGLGTLILYIISFIVIMKRWSREERFKDNTLERMLTIAWIGAGVFFLLPVVSGPGAFQMMGYAGLPLLLIPVAYLYVIGRHRLLDLELRIRRSAQYTIIAAVWGMLLTTGFVWLMTTFSRWDPDLPNIRLTSGSIEVLDEPMTIIQRTASEKVLIIVGSILLFVGFWKFGRIGLDFIAKRFHRTKYDYRRAATELTEVMSTRLTMSTLARGIVERLGELMKLKRVGVLFFRGAKECCCEEAYGFDGTTWREFCVRTDRRLIEAIDRFQGEFQTEYLPEEFKTEFRNHEFHFIVPIRSKDRLVGTILVGEKRSESTFQTEDLEFLRAVSRQASVAIENAFLYEELAGQERMKHELEIARNIQLESLPHTTPHITGLDIAGTSIPAMEVGGDYYDYLDGSHERITIVVGDVSGKGTSAALYMSKIQGMFRSLNAFGLSPHEMFSKTNKLLWNDIEKKSFVTAFGALFEPKSQRVALARAGHLPLLYYHAAGRHVQKILPRGMGMGLSGNGAFDEELEELRMSFEPGDVFLFVTDGITEEKNINGEEFGEDRLIELLQRHAHFGAEEIRDRVISAVKEFSGDALQHDDQTVVVVKARPTIAVH